MGVLKKFNEYLYSNNMKPNYNETEISKNNMVDKKYDYEEEYDDYHGSIGMKKIAKSLGIEFQGNEILYDGHKINFFSETDMYHVDRKKFKTPEEVITYLNNQKK